MENIKILAESIIHINEVKEEPMDHVGESTLNSIVKEEPMNHIGESTLNSIVKQEPEDHAVDHVGNFSEGGEGRSSLKREVKQEDEEEEVKPPVGVFLSPYKESNDEHEQQQKDPLASCNENVHGVGAWTDGVEGRAMSEKRRHLRGDALRRQQNCTASGAPALSVEQWRFQKHLGLRQPTVANKTREGNLNEDSDDREIPPQNCRIGDPTVVVEEHESNVQQGIRSALDETVTQAPPETPSPTQSPALTPTAIDTKSAKTKKKETIADLLKRRMEQQEERRKSRSAERKRIFEQMNAPSDSLYHFFLSMYGVTKSMPPSSQFAVRNSILRVVTDMEATLLNIPADHSHITPHSDRDQRVSFHEPQSSKRTSNQSWTRPSTPASPCHYDNTMSDRLS